MALLHILRLIEGGDSSQRRSFLFRVYFGSHPLAYPSFQNCHILGNPTPYPTCFLLSCMVFFTSSILRLMPYPMLLSTQSILTFLPSSVRLSLQSVWAILAQPFNIWIPSLVLSLMTSIGLLSTRCPLVSSPPLTPNPTLVLPDITSFLRLDLLSWQGLWFFLPIILISF